MLTRTDVLTLRTLIGGAFSPASCVCVVIAAPDAPTLKEDRLGFSSVSRYCSPG